MSENSPIEWTNATWNPVTGCDHCYALTLAARLKAMGTAKYQNDGDPRTSGPGFAVTIHPDALSVPARWRKPRLVFVDSMSDLFHAHVPTDFIRDVFDVIAATHLPATDQTTTPCTASRRPPPLAGEPVARGIGGKHRPPRPRRRTPPHPRPRRLRSVPFFFKQVGGNRPTSGGRLLDDRTWDHMPTHRQTATTGSSA